jgi:hypothetical protein
VNRPEVGGERLLFHSLVDKLLQNKSRNACFTSQNSSHLQRVQVPIIRSDNDQSMRGSKIIIKQRRGEGGGRLRAADIGLCRPGHVMLKSTQVSTSAAGVRARNGNAPQIRC